MKMTKRVKTGLFAFKQGLEGYSWDLGFDQNTVRDLGKRKISWRDSGFDCYQGSGICHNLGTGCRILWPVCREYGKSSPQMNVIAAKAANQPGERKISIERANLHLKFISFCRN